jgi:tetratricopeptide (TPR) repeat protein
MVDPAVEPIRAGLLHERRGEYLMFAQDLDSRFEALREAVRLIPTTPPSEERARVLASLAEALSLAGREEEAGVVSQEAITIARQVGAGRELGRAQIALGWTQANSGAFDAAVATLQQACRLAEKHSDFDLLARAYGWLTEVLMRANRLEDAAKTSLAGRESLRHRGLAGYWHETYMLDSAAEALFKLGRWDEAEELAQQALAQASTKVRPPDQLLAYLMVATLELARGKFREAQAHLETIEHRVLGGVRELARMYLGLLAELRVWQGRLSEAREAVNDGLARVVGTDEARSGRLACLGMRVAADWAEQARARHDLDDVSTAVRAADVLASRVEAMAPNPLAPGATPIPATPAVVALWNGERSRVHGRSDPAQWEVAGAAWLALRRPYPAAYAQWRQAEALLANRAPRAQVEEPLRAAHAVAARLGAAPLQRELESLARRGRIQLEPPAGPTMAEPEAPSVATSLG